MPARNLTYRPTAIGSLFSAHSSRAEWGRTLLSQSQNKIL